jgi:hypothetical protein
VVLLRCKAHCRRVDDWQKRVAVREQEAEEGLLVRGAKVPQIDVLVERVAQALQHRELAHRHEAAASQALWRRLRLPVLDDAALEKQGPPLRGSN